MAKLRVVHIVNQLGYGGAEHVLAELAGGLPPAEFEMSFVGLQQSNRPPRRLLDAGHEVISLEGRSRFHIPIRRLLGVLRARRPDVIHCHLSRAAATGGLAARLSGSPPLVASVHNHWGTAQHPLNRLLDSWTFSRCDVVVCVSEAVCDSIPAKYKRYRDFRVIRNCIDAQHLQDTQCGADELRGELSIPQGARVVGMVGRLAACKGHRTLLEALPAVLAQFPQTVVVLAGDGELLQPLRRLAQALGVAESVRFLGFRADVPRIMKLCEVLTIPSLLEGLPMVLLEACALGVPVVASDLPVFTEVIQDDASALTFPRGDAGALACSLIEALQAPERMAARGAQAQSTVTREFSAQAMVTKHRDLYFELAGGLPEQAHPHRNAKATKICH